MAIDVNWVCMFIVSPWKYIHWNRTKVVLYCGRKRTSGDWEGLGMFVEIGVVGHFQPPRDFSPLLGGMKREYKTTPPFWIYLEKNT